MKNRFIMLAGLPGSGKTTLVNLIRDTLVQKMNRAEEDVVWLGSDMIRKELYGTEKEQGDHEEVFNLMKQRTDQALRAGKDVIYDACNINSKKRKAFLANLKRFSGEKICVICATPYEVCLERNGQRSRVVAEHVIKKMYLNWNTPYYHEGWDQIYIYYSDGAKGFRGTPESFVEMYMDYLQDNPHHKETLGTHMKDTYEYLVENGYCKADSNLAMAALVHDCGKPFTKAFLDSRGNKTEIAHYYQHPCTGAHDALFFDFPDKTMEDVLEISVLINLHMHPFNWQQASGNTKLKKQWGEKLYQEVLLLHEADEAASVN